MYSSIPCVCLISFFQNRLFLKNDSAEIGTMAMIPTLIPVIEKYLACCCQKIPDNE
jgi:hypothetical protein